MSKIKHIIVLFLFWAAMATANSTQSNDLLARQRIEHNRIMFESYTTRQTEKNSADAHAMELKRKIILLDENTLKLEGEIAKLTQQGSAISHEKKALLRKHENELLRRQDEYFERLGALNKKYSKTAREFRNKLSTMSETREEWEAINLFHSGQKRIAINILKNAAASLNDGIEKATLLSNIAGLMHVSIGDEGITIQETISHYQQALEHDENHFWDWYNLAILQSEIGMYRDAMITVDRLVTVAETLYERAMAYSFSGGNAMDLGKRRMAIEHYKISLDQYEKLSQQEPDEPWHKRDISYVLGAMADAYEGTGDRMSSRTHLLRSMGIREQLLVHYPNTMMAHSDFGASLLALARLELSDSNLDIANDHAIRSLKIFEKVSMENPDNEWAQEFLSDGLSLIGKIFIRRDEPDMAMTYFQRVLHIRERHAAENTENITKKMRLIITLSDTGGLLSVLDKNKEAMEHFQKSLVIAEHIDTRIREDFSSRFILANLHDKIGDLYAQSSNPLMALTHYRHAQAISKSEEIDEEAESDLLYLWLLQHNNIAEVLSDIGKHEEALQQAMNGARLAKQHYDRTNDPSFLLLWALAKHAYADVKLDQKDLVTALAIHEEVLHLIRLNFEKNQAWMETSTMFDTTMATKKINLSFILLMTWVEFLEFQSENLNQDYDKALTETGKMRDYFSSITKRNPRNEVGKIATVTYHAYLVEILLNSGQLERANQHQCMIKNILRVWQDEGYEIPPGLMRDMSELDDRIKMFGC